MIDPRSYSGLVKKPTGSQGCSAVHQADFPDRFNLLSPPDVMFVEVCIG